MTTRAAEKGKVFGPNALQALITKKPSLRESLLWSLNCFSKENYPLSGFMGIWELAVGYGVTGYFGVSFIRGYTLFSPLLVWSQTLFSLTKDFDLQFEVG